MTGGDSHEAGTDRGATSAANAREWEARAKRWAQRHPHVVMWRLLVWLRYARNWPTVSDLALCDPRPLDAALVAGLMTKDPYECERPLDV